MSQQRLITELTYRVVEAAKAAFGEHLHGVIVKGSALKSDGADFIPYYSDFDCHVFVASVAMRGPLAPRLDYALAFQERIGKIDPDDYQIGYCQVLFFAESGYPDGWTRPLPETYRVAYGHVPVGFDAATSDEYIASAQATLRQLPARADGLIGGFIDRPDERITRDVRLLGTFLKPAAYAAATLLTGEPFRVWRSPLTDVLSIVEPTVCPSHGISRFFAGVREWRSVREDGDTLRQLLRVGIGAMDEIIAWYERHGQTPAALTETRD